MQYTCNFSLFRLASSGITGGFVFPTAELQDSCWAPASPVCALRSPPGPNSPSWLGASSVSHVRPARIPPERFDAMFFFTSPPKVVEGSTSFVPFLTNPSRCCGPVPIRGAQLHSDLAWHLPFLLMTFYFGQRTGVQSP